MCECVCGVCRCVGVCIVVYICMCVWLFVGKVGVIGEWCVSV